MMQPGDIALVPADNPWGDVVAFSTRSRYVHVRLITDSGGGTVEALPSGATTGHIRYGDVIVHAPLTDAQRLDALAIALDIAKRRVPYDFVDMLALGLAQYGVRAPIVAERLGREDRLFCSQLVDLVWTLAGYHAFTDKRLPGNVSPGDLADLAFTHGWIAYQLERAQP